MSRRVKDMELGELVTCSKHGGAIPLSGSMRASGRRICDACLSVYKSQRAKAKRAAARSPCDGGDLPGETWLPIPGCSGYRASNLGRIRSLERTDLAGRFVAAKIMKPNIREDGYVTVGIRADDELMSRTRRLHTLICLAFLGERPPGNVVAHKNGERADNRLQNLRYATPSENEEDKLAHGTRFYPKGVLSPAAKLVDSQVFEIRARLQKGEAQSSIAAAFSIDQSMVSHIKRKKHWTHLE